MQGGRGILVDGQRLLAKVAKEAGVRRIIPSTFSSELFNINLSDNNIVNNNIFKIRREAAEAIASTGLPATHIMNGTFMKSMIDFPPLTPFNFEKGIFSYWGNGQQTTAYTTLFDAAEYTAEAAFDSDPPSELRVAGDILTMKEMKETYELVTGLKLTENSLGSIQDLREDIAQRKADATCPADYIYHQIRYSIAVGEAGFSPLSNDRYPTVRPVNFKDFIRSTLL